MKKIILFIALTMSLQMHAQNGLPKIIGGTNAVNGEFPWMVGLSYAGENLFDGQFCGGSLINASWVLTAAHCLYENGNVINPNELFVFTDAHQLSSPNAGMESINVTQIFVHPNYDDFTLDNDIALLRLSSRSTKQSITLPIQNDESRLVSGTEMTIMGWGVVNNTTQEYADILQKANVNTISNSLCNSADFYDGEITNNMFCAASPGRDACVGDSGGPIVYKDGNNFIQQGIVSWGGEECADPFQPGVYTKLSNYVNWINNTILNTDISDVKEEESISIFQQGNTITINNERHDIASAAIIDQMGRILLLHKFSQSAQIDMSDMPTGIYFVQVHNADAQSVKKVYKQ
jgi:trypsin